MTSRTLLHTACLSAGLLLATGAGAVSVNLGLSTLNGNLIDDASSAGVLSFDVDHLNNSEIILVIDTELGDFLGIPPLIEWNGFYNNSTIDLWEAYTVNVSPPVEIAFIGSVNEEFAPSSSVNSVDAQTAEILFGLPGEASGFELGAAPLGNGPDNWRLDLTGLLPGDSFTLTLTPSAVPVPVPAAVWLFGSALAGLGWIRRRTAG